MRSPLSSPVVVVAATLLVASCGGGSGSPTTPSPSQPGPSPGATAFVITVVREAGAQSFDPSPASAGGLAVVFRNADTVVHRVMMNDGSIDTGDIAPGATSRELQMPAAGTNYHCSIHPAMIGQVNAEGGAPAPPCTGLYCD
jgi:plastocyanin